MAPVVVFDFDKTLTKYDTILPFFVYCASKSGIRYMLLPIYLILKVLSKNGLITVKREKELGLRLLCPRAHKKFQEYAKQFAKKLKKESLNNVYTSEFIMCKQAGARVVIASASFADYLRHIFPDDLVIGSECKLADNGMISGLSIHPYKKAKAEALKIAGIEQIDVFYTDSSTDMPVANMSKAVKWVKDGAIVA